MPNYQFKYADVTEKIIGCSMAVHSTLGNGFQEVIYQRALELEFKAAGLDFNREFEMPIFYRGEKSGCAGSTSSSIKPFPWN